ncbi:MAG: methylmalonyl-CoA epimerase [SAR202 cluster bacterium]|jgi:methylmalonyl-CoA/ethylmalonyl-CoA epimerase|nr:methylmalonyl-CoA epimerase [SAR202 cluster bacterium]
MTKTAFVCTVEHINHVGIAVRDIEATLSFYGRIFGAGTEEIESLEDQGIRAALVRVGGSQLEFIQPIDPDNSVARFIGRRGEGLHHLCFEVEDLDAKLKLLDEEGIQLIDRTPRKGLTGSIAFLHPKSTGGTLIELVDQDTARR